jgi:hypothetical protein
VEGEESLLFEEETDEYEDSGATQLLRSTFSSVTLFLSESLLGSPAIGASSTSSFAMLLPESLSGSSAIGASPLVEGEESLLFEEETDEYEDSGETQLLRSTFSSVTLFLSESLLGSPAIGALPWTEGEEDDDDDSIIWTAQDEAALEEEIQVDTTTTSSEEYGDNLLDASVAFE